jgi:uncharacterized protein
MVKRRTPPPDATGLSVPVRVRPGAGRTQVGGRYDGPHGPALIVAVGAPAVDGKATEAVRRALAAALGVRAADVSLRVGPASRDKVFTVACPKPGAGAAAGATKAGTTTAGAARAGAARAGAARAGAARAGAARAGTAEAGADVGVEGLLRRLDELRDGAG